MDNNLFGDLSREQICRHFNLSPNYFSRIFSENAPMPFLQYITARRMNRAMELLAGTEQSISDIAAMTGYGDIQYFWRVFIKQTGMTPYQYRTREKANP